MSEILNSSTDLGYFQHLNFKQLQAFTCYTKSGDKGMGVVKKLEKNVTL